MVLEHEGHLVTQTTALSSTEKAIYARKYMVYTGFWSVQMEKLMGLTPWMTKPLRPTLVRLDPLTTT